MKEIQKNGKKLIYSKLHTEINSKKQIIMKLNKNIKEDSIKKFVKQSGFRSTESTKEIKIIIAFSYSHSYYLYITEIKLMYLIGRLFILQAIITKINVLRIGICFKEQRASHIGIKFDFVRIFQDLTREI